MKHTKCDQCGKEITGFAFQRETKQWIKPGCFSTYQFCNEDCARAFHPKNPNAVALGRLGGKAGRGQCKARSTEQARRAVMVRWAKRNQAAQLAKQGYTPLPDDCDRETQ